MSELNPAQLDVAVAFFALRESEGFVLVGGAALLALELIERPTEDLDFFTDDPTRIASAVNALVVVAGPQRVGSRVDSFDSHVSSFGADL